jgi:acyl carrier protein
VSRGQGDDKPEPIRGVEGDRIMDERNLKEMVAEILEVEPGELQKTSELDSFNAYDSVAKLSLLVGLSDFVGRPVTVPELMELQTFGDILKLARIDSANGHHS